MKKVLVSAATIIPLLIGNPLQAQASIEVSIEKLIKDLPKTWKELSNQQRNILAPLAKYWDNMDWFQRKEWLLIAQGYQKLPPRQQSLVQKRMDKWIKLTPEQRSSAREKYRKIKPHSAEEKEMIKSYWKEYQRLPESEKQKWRNLP